MTSKTSKYTTLTSFTVLTAIHQSFSPQKEVNKIHWSVRLLEVTVIEQNLEIS